MWVLYLHSGIVNANSNSYSTTIVFVVLVVVVVVVHQHFSAGEETGDDDKRCRS